MNTDMELRAAHAENRRVGQQVSDALSGKHRNLLFRLAFNLKELSEAHKLSERSMTPVQVKQMKAAMALEELAQMMELEIHNRRITDTFTLAA